MNTWNASYISTGRPSGPEDPAVSFRRDFDAPTHPVRATLRPTSEPESGPAA